MKKILVMLVGLLALVGVCRVDADYNVGDFGTLPEVHGLRVVGPTPQAPLWLKGMILFSDLEQRVGKFQIYQLQGTLPEGEGTAWLLTGTLSKEHAAEWLGGDVDKFFADPTDSGVLRELAAWNLKMYDAEPSVNEWLREQLSKYTPFLQQQGLWREGDRWEDVPSLFTVQLRDFEPLRRVPGAYSTMYTVGERVVLEADGSYVTPLYVQVYLRKYRDQIRWACLFTADVERDYFKNQVWRSMKTLPAN